MKNWIRVFLISSALIGGAVFFAYQSLTQFNNALDTMSASYIAIANTRSISLPDKTSGERISTTTLEAISTTTPETIATTTLTVASSTVETGAKVKLSLVFPSKSSGGVYSGCTYKISLPSSTTIHSLGMALVDAGTRETIGPIASGLPKVQKIASDAQSLDWRVGAVWPGEYVILVSKINDVEAETRSKYFMIREMPEDISASERVKICKESGGSF